MPQRDAVWHIPDWVSWPETTSLPEEEVHVWYVTLPADPVVLRRVQASLSDDELRRAARFRRERDRVRFVLARGLLRNILGLYAGLPPGAIALKTDPYGKPALAHQSAGVDVRFNVSHSADRAIYAVACGRDVGVDIEVVQVRADLLALARRFFSVAEYARLGALSDEDLPPAFYRHWTSKEALLKASGAGLSIDLSVFEVHFEAGSHDVGLASAARPQEAARWSIRSFSPERGIMAALAVEGAGWQPVFIRPDPAASF